MDWSHLGDGLVESDGHHGLDCMWHCFLIKQPPLLCLDSGLRNPKLGLCHNQQSSHPKNLEKMHVDIHPSQGSPCIFS